MQFFKAARARIVWAVAVVASISFLVNGLHAAEEQTSESAVKVDVRMNWSQVPEMEDWGKQVKAEVERMYPIIARRLHSEGFTPAKTVYISIRNMKGVAGTGGNRIFLAAAWFKAHPDDIGAVIHEIVHVIQASPKYDPVWLIEGIADYVRFWEYEPEAKRPQVNPDRANYKDGYRTAGAFLAWIEGKYDKELVRKLSGALRASEYKDSLFKEYTGKELDELWREYTAELRAARQAKQ